MKRIDEQNLLLAKYLAKEKLTDIQQNEVEEWIRSNGELYEEIKKLYQSESSLDEYQYFDTSSAWNRVESRLNSSRKRIFENYKIIQIAAMIVLIAGISLLWLQRDRSQTFEYFNNTLSVQIISLPDKSTVEVYPRASISYKDLKNKGVRSVTLKGKALFNVTKRNDQAFIIDAYDTQIRVVGTSFLVNALADHNTNVEVMTGVVDVITNDETITLKKNDQIIIDDESLIFNRYLANNSVLNIKFKRTPIADVISLLESRLGIEIDIQRELLDNTITTTLDSNDINQILDELSLLCQCKYRKKVDGSYLLYL